MGLLLFCEEIMPEVFAGGMIARLWKKVYYYVQQSSWAIGAPMSQSRQSSQKQREAV